MQNLPASQRKRFVTHKHLEPLWWKKCVNRKGEVKEIGEMVDGSSMPPRTGQDGNQSSEKMITLLGKRMLYIFFCLDCGKMWNPGQMQTPLWGTVSIPLLSLFFVRLGLASGWKFFLWRAAQEMVIASSFLGSSLSFLPPWLLLLIWLVTCTWHTWWVRTRAVMELSPCPAPRTFHGSTHYSL